MNNHEDIVLSHEEKFKNIDKRLCNLEEQNKEIIELGKCFASMKVTVEKAVDQTAEHIIAGSKWRMTIVSSCVILVGTIIAVMIRFGIVESKVNIHENDLRDVRTQLYGLNFEKGRAIGLSEKK